MALEDGLNTIIGQCNHISSQVQAVGQYVSVVQGQVTAVSGQLAAAQAEIIENRNKLIALANQLKQMESNAELRASLQKALTEIVRVRQEIAQKFPKHQTVRDTMVGILQATDNALVSKDTINRISEELMISTPGYWLAPCLLAVAAWIDNNQALSERAIKEACSRSMENTALTMAFICRRNNRVDTCYEWLGEYFKLQKASEMTRSIVTYITAYTNGVFGPDKRGICQDYIDKWMDEIGVANPDFKQTQLKEWTSFFEELTPSQREKYPTLAKYASNDFDSINAYASRVEASPKIIDYFDRIQKSEIDNDELIKEVDNNLFRLVNQYDTTRAKEDEPTEDELRSVEHRFQLIKEYKGDEQKADKHIEVEQMPIRKLQEKVNLIQRLSSSIKSSDVTMSEKKTSFAFLQTYIKEGYEDYITEKKEVFPKQIIVTVDECACAIEKKEDSDACVRRYSTYIEGKRVAELKTVKLTAPIILLIIGVILLVVGCLTNIIIAVLGAVPIIIAIVLFVKKSNKKKEINQRRNAQFARGKSILVKACEEWGQVSNTVNTFVPAEVV